MDSVTVNDPSITSRYPNYSSSSTMQKPSYYLPNQIDINSLFLPQFGLIHTRLIPTPSELKLSPNNVPNLNVIRKEAGKLEKNLMTQHKNRAAEIIKENRKRAVTYWAAQQMLYHNRCKEPGVVVESLVAPTTSFVMPLHVTPSENRDIEETRREHEKRVGLVHRNSRSHLNQSLYPTITTTSNSLPDMEPDNDWEYDPSKLCDPLAPLLSETGCEKMITTRFFFPVSSESDTAFGQSKSSKLTGRKNHKKKLTLKRKVLQLAFNPMIPSIDELGFPTHELSTILCENGFQLNSNTNWMGLLPSQLRSYHRITNTPPTIVTGDDTSEDNRADEVSEIQGSAEKESIKSNSLAVAYIPTIIPLPKSLTWVKLRDNYRVDDQTVLRYIPYFGDDDTTGLDLSAYEFVPWELEGDIGGEVIETTISTIIGRYQHLFDNEENVLIAEEINANGTGESEIQIPSSLESMLMKLFSISVTQLRQAKKHGDIYSDLLICNQLQIPEENEQKLVLRHGSIAFLPLFLRGIKESLTHQLDDLALDEYGYRAKPDYKSVAENYLDMFCRRCYKYDCRTHGIEQPKQRLHEDPQNILVVNENGLLVTESSFNRRNKRRKQSSVENPLPEEIDDHDDHKESEALSLNPEYYQASDGTYISYGRYRKSISHPLASPALKKQKSESDNPHATPSECIVASRLRDMIFTSNPTLFEEYKRSGKLPLSVTSNIAFLLGTCTPPEVDEIFSRFELTSSGSKKSQSIQKLKFDKQQINKSQTKARAAELQIDEESEKVVGPLFNLGTALTNIRKDGFSLVHQPCDHEGPCVLGVCPCVDSTGYCETDCACPSSCKNRFQGCKCAPGQCRTLLCRCVTASRECDPNLCHSCGVAIHPYLRQPYCQFISSSQQTFLPSPKIDELAARDPRLDRKYCQNTQILLNQGKKVSMGRSSIHGWGLFLREDVKKGDFIMEYKGEIISQDEAERRGKLFDKIDSSFLFNLSTEFVIDATRKGSKAKFANHSKDDPNCGPRIKLVKGDHRIGIYALKNLPAGTELTFDYLYAGEEAPRWACKSAKRNDFLL